MIGVPGRTETQADIDHKPDIAVFDVVEHVGLPLAHLADRFRRDAVFPQTVGRAARGQNLESHAGQGFGHGKDAILVMVVDTDEYLSRKRYLESGRHLGFRIGETERTVDSHHLSRGFHFRPQQDVRMREAAEGEDRFLHRDVPRPDRFTEAQLPQGFPQHHLGGQLRQRNADRLADERNCPGGPGVDLQHEKLAVLHCVLDVHQSHHAEFPGNPLRLAFDPLKHFRREADRRKGTGAVAGVDSRLLDMLHDSGDDGGRAVADCVHIHLDRVLKELVDQDRMAGGDLQRPGHERLQTRGVVNDLHRTAAKDIGGADQDRVADPFGSPDSLLRVHRRVAVGLPEPQPVDNFLKSSAVLGPVDRVGGGAQDRHPGHLQSAGQIQRGLAAELNDDAQRLFRPEDVQHILQRHRFEKEPVGGVVIGAHRLRIRIDHDALVSLFPQREGGVDAAVVELDPLADPVGPAAQNDDLRFRRRAHLILILVGRVVIRGVGLELGRAGVHKLVDRQDSRGIAAAADLPFGKVPDRAEGLIGKAEPFGPVENLRRTGCPSNLLLRLDKRSDLVEKPRVDLCQAMDLLQSHPVLKSRGDVEEAKGVGPTEPLLQKFPGAMGCSLGQIGLQAEASDLQRADGLLERLPKGPADGHGLADRFHRRGQQILGVGKLLKGPAGDLDDTVIDGRFEGGHRFSCDVVGNFVEGITDGELRGNLGDRKTGRLGGEGRRSGYPGVHFDDNHLPGFGMDRELDVGAAGLDADLTHDRDGGVPHPLVLNVGQRLGRSDGDRLARMDAHRVQVFDRADDHDVVRPVAHHLQFVLFPAQGRLFEHHLVDQRRVEAALGDFGKLLPVVGDAASGPAQSERGADDDGKSDFGRHRKDIIQ